jgi:LysR family carnitine catabolism transcriptional activator
MISLSKIRGFVAVAELGSFRLASEEIGRSQPALSTQISDLEDSLGAKLFARTTRKTVLTPEGERFLIGAKRAIVELDSIVMELKDEAALNRGRVALGCVPTLAAHVLPPIIAGFTQSYPAIEVEIYDDVAAVLYDKVGTGELDFAICPEPVKRGDLKFEKKFTDQFVVVFPTTHRFAGKTEVTLSQVLKEDNLTLVKGTNVRTVLDAEIERAGQIFEPRYEVINHYSLGGMVEGGLGVAMLPRNAFPMLRESRLAYALVSRPSIGRAIGILTSSWRPSTPATSAFLETLEPILETAYAAEPA